MSHASAVVAGARMVWMDLLRGAAIVLVVLAHATIILVRFGYGTSPGWLVAATEVFTPFRMPALMLLSGMLLPRALAKPLPIYLGGKFRAIGWPYVLWTAGFFLLFPMAGSVATLDSWLTAYTWYLLYILLFYLAAPVTRWVPTWLLVVIPWLVSAALTETFSRRFFFLMGFFFLGKLAADHRDRLERLLANRWAWLTVPAAGVIGVVSALTDPPRYWGALALFSLVGVIAAAVLARRFADNAWTRPLQYIGRHSLIYYVTHFPVITAVVIAGFALGARVEVIIVAGLVIALALGTAAAWLSDHTALRVLFAWPARRSPRAVPAPAR